MILQVGDMVEVKCHDIVTANGWNEKARVGVIVVRGTIKTLPNRKSPKPELEIVGIIDDGMVNTNQATAIPLSLILEDGIRKLQYCKGKAELP